jgi:hypothetical protein
VVYHLSALGGTHQTENPLLLSLSKQGFSEIGEKLFTDRQAITYVHI